jgi:hypothetical protein
LDLGQVSIPSSELVNGALAIIVFGPGYFYFNQQRFIPFQDCINGFIGSRESIITFPFNSF